MQCKWCNDECIKQINHTTKLGIAGSLLERRSRGVTKMDQSKKEFLPVLQGVKLSKTQSPTMAEDRKRMKVIPYATVIGSIKYVVLCTRPIVYLDMSLARGTIVI